jgi:hypothetical protein
MVSARDARQCEVRHLALPWAVYPNCAVLHPALAMRCVLAIFALSCVAASLSAQRSALVPLDDPVYRAIDRLAAAGLVDTLIVGQRPYSRGEVARIVGEARHQRASANSRLAKLIDQIDDEFSRTRYDGRLAVIATATTDRPRAIPPDTGLGAVNAIVAPLGHSSGPRGGRDALRGTTLAVEVRNALDLGRNVSVVAHPRWRASTEAAATDERPLSWVELAARLRASNAVLSLGRAPLRWGQARRSTLFLSDNARALDMIWLGSDRPWTMPGVLRTLGPTSLSIFFADLGLRQHFPHTKLIGYKASIAPSPNVELGLSALDFVGGRGAPRATTGRILKNLFLRPFLPVEGYQFSNQMLGLEARVRWPARTELYWEMNLDDFDKSRVASSIWTDDAAHVFGLALPAGHLDATLEFHHTGTRFNRHQQFLSGPTVNDRLLGEPLGPDADGAYAFVDWGESLGIELATEVYRADQYIITQPPMRFHRIERRPRERRHRAILTMHRTPQRDVTVSVNAGVERVSRFGFLDGVSRTNAVANVVLSVRVR